MKILQIFLITTLIVLLSPITYASEQFATSYDVTYDIDQTGETSITQKISITNLQNDVIATSYTLSINNMDIYDITGNDAEGKLEISNQSHGATTTLNTKFNEQIIGEGRTLDWELKYKSKDIATKVGEVWNIHIPKIDTPDSVEKYDVALAIPENFGPKVYISPQPVLEETELGTTKLIYNKEILQGKGISASFGENQILNFQLSYKLKNDSILSSIQEIALPPDIQGVQQVYYLNIEPKPMELYEDDDGNTLARYKVSPKTELNIELSGTAKISGRQIKPEFGGNMEKLPKNIVKTYTKEEPYWEVRSDEIGLIAEELVDSDLTTSQNAKKVYDYITTNLDYNFEITQKTTIERQGALKALTNLEPWACMEFTDLFIAITRSMGIPSRELNGYAFTQESNLTPLSISLRGGDLLHSWAEFYDPNFGWVQVDPTWGNTSKSDYFTKLDTSHFVFVIKGLNSEYPFPAGTYKIDGNEKQVEVAVAQEIAQDAFTPKIQVYKRGLLDKYVIYNNGGTKLYNVNGTGRDLLPFDHMKVSIDNDANIISYKDFNNTDNTLEFSITEGKIPNKHKAPILPSALAALVLCSLIYLFAIHPEIPQKLLDHLRRLLQAPSQ
jgi:transglutaminase-like putative cysteine protease